MRPRSGQTFRKYRCVDAPRLAASLGRQGSSLRPGPDGPLADAGELGRLGDGHVTPGCAGRKRLAVVLALGLGRLGDGVEGRPDGVQAPGSPEGRRHRRQVPGQQDAAPTVDDGTSVERGGLVTSYDDLIKSHPSTSCTARTSSPAAARRPSTVGQSATGCVAPGGSETAGVG